MVRLLISLVMFVLARAASAEAALDCRHALPLPDDVRLVPPAADVPADVARFAGAWSGGWTDRKGNEAQCSMLVVEEVFANGYARSIYSIGGTGSLGSGIPNVWRVTGRIEGDVLLFSLPIPAGGRFAYRIDGARLSATFNNDEGRASFARISDPAALACRRDARVASAAPASVRDRLTRDDLFATASPTVGAGAQRLLHAHRRGRPASPRAQGDADDPRVLAARRAPGLRGTGGQVPGAQRGVPDRR